MTIPANTWEVKRLGDCLEMLQSGKFAERGWSPQCLNHPVKNDDIWAVLKTTAVQMGEYKPEYNKELPSSLEPKSGLEVNPGDFLVTTTGPRNRCGIVCHVRTTPKKLIFSGKILRFRANEEVVLANWLMFLLMSPEYQKIFDKMKVGTSDSSVSIGNKQVLDLEIPVPSINEQKRIIELIEDHLTRLDVALRDVKQVRSKAYQLRRSLLQSAFEGNLQSVGDPHPYSDWQAEKLSNLLAVSIGGIWGEEPGVADVDVEVVRVTELKAHGRIDPASAVTRSVTFKQLESRELQEGDLLLEKSGGGPNSPVGRVGYFSMKSTRTVCSNFMQLMRPDTSKVIPKFLFYFLDIFHSNGGTIPMQTATTNIRNIKTPQYMEIEVPLPTLETQVKVMELLEDYLSRLDSSVELADAMEKQAAGLRRSLLQAAFTGQLTNEVISV